MSALKTANSAAVESVRNLFGEFPEDVISPIKSAAEALDWLHEILKTISQEALSEGNGHRIKHLAEAGAYIAFDMAEYAGTRYEALRDNLRNAVAVSKGGDHE